MLIQYQYRREQFLKELSSILEELNIKPADLEFVQNSINGLQTANFILHCVKKPRHTFQVCLRFLPCSEQNFLVFASSSKFEQTLNVFVTVSSNLFEHLLKGLNENEPCSSPQICVNKNGNQTIGGSPIL